MAYPTGKAGVERVAFVGIGKKEKVTAEEVRRVAALCYNSAKDRGAESLWLSIPKNLAEKLGDEPVGRALAEGFVLGAYKYDRLKSRKPTTAPRSPRRSRSLGKDTTSSSGSSGACATAPPRTSRANFEDAPANYATPSVLASAAKKLSSPRVSVRILEESDMKKLGMGAILGVAQGSEEPAKLISLHYKPKKKAKETIALVGKGLTFDSGGISIKPSAAMDEMKYDMCGGGAVLGTFHALRELDLPLEIIGIVPSTENLPSGTSYKPGDVVRACNGTTIEVLNTDAEGRLILCDAIAYVEKQFKPDIIIDLATSPAPSSWRSATR